MAIPPNLLLLFLTFSDLFPAPADGKPLPIPPLHGLLLTLCTPPLCLCLPLWFWDSEYPNLDTPGPAFYCEVGWAMQVYIPIWQLGGGHWELEYSGFWVMCRELFWKHCGHNEAQHRKAEAMFWGSPAHPFPLESSNPAQHRTHKFSEHQADPDVHNVDNVHRHLAEWEFFETNKYWEKEWQHSTQWSPWKTSLQAMSYLTQLHSGQTNSQENGCQVTHRPHVFQPSIA